MSCAELVLKLQNLDYVLTMGSFHEFDLRFFVCFLFSNKIAMSYFFVVVV